MLNARPAFHFIITMLTQSDKNQTPHHPSMMVRGFLQKSASYDK
jgi:hypothetical protein